MIIEKPESRARSVAILGLVAQLVFTLGLILLWSFSRSQSIQAVMRLSGIGVVIWVVLLLIHHQRKLVQDEDLESEELQRERERGTSGEALFDVAGERLLLARRRLDRMYQWVLPIFTVVTAGLLVLAGLTGWSWSFAESFSSSKWPEIQLPHEQKSILVWFLGGGAFLSFLLSRYVVGMARHSEWQMLRAGSSYLMGLTLSMVATGAVLAVHVFTGNPVPEHVLAFVLRILMLVLAAEFLLNFVLDFYRPRAPGDAPRPSFDSRLLGLFSEPGGIARSIAEAINYQFGFDVSSTWFYQLLQRSVVPLFGFAVVTLILASSLVFVDSNERAVIEHFGTKVAVVDPGLHVTWPWPIDVAYKVAVDQIHELKIGLEESSPDQDQKKDELILWTNKHSQEPHQMVLLATPQLTEIIQNIERSATSRPAAVATTTQPAGDKEMGKAVPVSMLRVAAVIQYRIRDAYDWIKQYEKPEKMLESIANREITIRCAHADVLGLMGSDREQIEKEIGEAIQASADRVKLGIEIKFFGLQGVHPPSELGEDFQKVISAEHQKIAAINSARAEANKKLTEAAGDVDVTQARQLEQAITEMNRVANAAGVTDAERTQAQDRVRELFFGTPDRVIRPIGGKAAVRVAAARSERWRLENEAAARAVLFEKQLDIKNAAPRVFKMREYLAVLDRSMNKARKYIIAVQGPYELPMFQLNLMDPLSASLDVALDKDKP